MDFKNYNKYFIHFIFFILILIFAVSCQNCTSTNADNKSDNKSDSATIYKDSLITKKDTISKFNLLGKIIPSKDTNFIALDQKYTSKKGFYLRKEAYKAFIKMFDAAQKEGVKLSVISATRTFNEQKWIWDGKWTGKTLYYGKNIATEYPNPIERSKYVLKYSSMPGTSRHHWGTDMDLNSTELTYYKTETGEKMYKWLSENASKYGFCQPYTIKDSLRISGYEEEKWHWSYFPLSSLFLEQYKEKVTYDDLKNFEGFETAKQLDIIKNYVLSVNKNCK